MKCHYLGCHNEVHFVVGKFDTWVTTCDAHLVRYAKLITAIHSGRLTLKVIGSES